MFKYVSPVWLAVIGLPIFIFCAPLIPTIHQHMMWFVMGLAALFIVLAGFCKAYFDALLASVVLVVFAAVQIFFPETDERVLTLRTAAILSFVLLNIVLWIGPWSRFSSMVRGWYRHRRHLGVTAFFLGLLHFSVVFSHYFQRSFHQALLPFFTFFGFTALFIMLFLALTSWDWVQKHVGNTRWKKIHLGVFLLYAFFVLYTIWIQTSNGTPITFSSWVLLGSFLLFWIAAAPWGLAPRFIRFLNGWKQFHVLTHIAFASLVMHTWLGAAASQPMWVKVVFVGLVAFTWGSHLVGWCLKWREDKKRKHQAAQSRRIDMEGKGYWSLLPVEAFVEGRGQKFLVKGLPVAIFRYQDRFFGLFAMCPHQKGPIHQGKIVDGYVKCPWHGWQFSCRDGTAPPGFHDRLAYYPCVVKDGIVYVSELPGRG